MSEPDSIYVQFSEDGAHIRKWSTEPFEGGVQFVRLPPVYRLDEIPSDVGKSETYRRPSGE